jgi:RNA recognition motif-containing protein
MNKKLYVGNLSFETGDTELEKLFGKAGKVESARVMSGRGFAFVEMASEGDAQNAVSMFNGYSLHGRSLAVNEARPQVERKSGGYRPGGHGRR